MPPAAPALPTAVRGGGRADTPSALPWPGMHAVPALLLPVLDPPEPTVTRHGARPLRLLQGWGPLCMLSVLGGLAEFGA